MLRIVASIAFYAVLAAGPASIGVRAAEPNLALPVPKGYCALSSRHEADRALLEFSKKVNAGRNRLLKNFADCAALKKFRKSGGGLVRRGGYMAPRSALGKRVSMPRRIFVEKVAKASRRIDFAAVEKSVRDRAGKAGADSRARTVQQVGVIHTDENAVYYGVVQNVANAKGEMTTVATVSGLTVVRGRVISINLSRIYTSRKSLQQLLKSQQRNIRQLIVKNADSKN